jgi:hypothetical protein
MEEVKRCVQKAKKPTTKVTEIRKRIQKRDDKTEKPRKNHASIK